MKNKKYGFTLTELLLTLSILGVVAAIIIPIMVQSTNKAEYYTGLTEVYSQINRTTKMIMIDNGGSLSGALGGTSTDMMNKFAEKMSFTRTCLPNNDAGVCWHDGVTSWKNLSGANGWSDFNPTARAVLNNGMLLAFNNDHSLCGNSGYVKNSENQQCGRIIIDINGFKGPNQAGRDIFNILVTKYGAIPMGSEGTGGWTNFNNYCRVASAEVANGTSCAAKVLMEGKINY